MPTETGSTEPQPSRGTTNSGLVHRTPTLASALTRGWRRQIGHRLDEARYHVGIDLGTPVVEAIGAEARSRFTGHIPRVTIEVRDASPAAEAAARQARKEVGRATE